MYCLSAVSEFVCEEINDISLTVTARVLTIMMFFNTVHAALFILINSYLVNLSMRRY